MVHVRSHKSSHLPRIISINIKEHPVSRITAKRLTLKLIFTKTTKSQEDQHKLQIEKTTMEQSKNGTEMKAKNKYGTIYEEVQQNPNSRFVHMFNSIKIYTTFYRKHTTWYVALGPKSTTLLVSVSKFQNSLHSTKLLLWCDQRRDFWARNREKSEEMQRIYLF